MLEIRGLYAIKEGKEILRGIDLSIPRGEIHAIMGPNGAGKSTLAKVLAGDPSYETVGEIFLDGLEISALPPEERARLGVFLGFQYPVEIPGITNLRFLHAAHSALQTAKGNKSLSLEQFEGFLDEHLTALSMCKEWKHRGINEGFSGGEKKRNEILQMAVLDPKLAVLDETDSGLDIDALKSVAEGLATLAKPTNAILLITHYQRLLDHVSPHVVHVLLQGKIIESGGPEIAKKLELEGYDPFIQREKCGIKGTL